MTDVELPPVPPFEGEVAQLPPAPTFNAVRPDMSVAGRSGATYVKHDVQVQGLARVYATITLPNGNLQPADVTGLSEGDAEKIVEDEVVKSEMFERAFHPDPAISVKATMLVVQPTEI
mgnify:CR=1 FL=1|tara:strand:+ start:1169 stop:1522 length:354 start_codon:yes stop_codon:yes gene_type:complete